VGSEVVTWNIDGDSLYAINPALADEAMQFHIGSHKGGTSGNSASAFFKMPDLHIDWEWSDPATWHSSLELEVICHDVWGYGLDTSGIKATCSSMSIYLNGVLQASPAGWDQNSTGVGPHYIPFLGSPIRLAGACGASN